MFFSQEAKALLRAALVSIILALASTVLVYCTGIPETWIGAISKGIIIVTVLAASGMISRAHGNKGLIRGVSTGIMIFIILAIITLAASSYAIDFKNALSTLGICLVSGAIGGVIGVGMSDNK